MIPNTKQPETSPPSTVNAAAAAAQPTMRSEETETNKYKSKDKKMSDVMTEPYVKNVIHPGAFGGYGYGGGCGYGHGCGDGCGFGGGMSWLAILALFSGRGFGWGQGFDGHGHHGCGFCDQSGKLLTSIEINKVLDAVGLTAKEVSDARAQIADKIGDTRHDIEQIHAGINAGFAAVDAHVTSEIRASKDYLGASIGASKDFLSAQIEHSKDVNIAEFRAVEREICALRKENLETRYELSKSGFENTQKILDKLCEGEKAAMARRITELEIKLERDRGDHRHRESEVNIIQRVDQNQAQAQAQFQRQTIDELRNKLFLAELEFQNQRVTQKNVQFGTGNTNTPTANAQQIRA